MTGITRSLVTTHALGRADAYHAALLDIAQDHVLYLLAEAGMFDGDDLVFNAACRGGGRGVR